MVSTQETRVTVRPDFDGPYLEGMAWDLATVSGALSEIATTWRRALPCRPDLPLDPPPRLPRAVRRRPALPLALPQRLADMARRLAADIRALAAAGAPEAPGQDRAPDLAR